MFFISSTVRYHSAKNMFRDSSEGSNKPYNDELIQPLKQGKIYPISQDGTHKLHIAAKHNDIEVINFFIERGFELDVEDSSGTTPLITAVMHDNYRAAAMLHNARVDLFARQLYGQKASFIPWSFTQRAMVRLTMDMASKLKDKGFDSKQTGDILAKVCCCLDEVVRLHDPDLTKGFLESDCAPNYGENQTIFRTVMPKLDVRHVEVLLHHGGELESRRLEFFRDLMDNISSYHETEQGRTFLKKLFRWEILNESTLEYLQLALKDANGESVKTFLQYGFHSAAKAKFGRDVLAGLYGNRNAKVIFFLKNDEIDVGARGYEGKTPLHFAVENDVTENIKFLLDKGADPDEFDEAGSTPLLEAFCKLNKLLNENEKCSSSCVQLLLQSGANPLVCNNYGETIFDYGNSTFRKFTTITKLVLAQLAIHEALGVPVEHYVDALINLTDNKLRKYYEECRQQLKMLQTHEVRNTRDSRVRKLSMFTILAEKPDQLVCYVNDEDLLTIYAFMKKYSKKKLYYYDNLKSHIDDIETLTICRDTAIEVISECTKVFDPHHLFVDKIVNYLTAKDLLKYK